jgi:alkanesulfonate monooxygenase SsuD/methylene tetrahydromethanopterin reductase-like flavin-dependent oxidoreductase (luciferase family)
MAKVEIGILLPTRGEIMYSPANPNFDNVMGIARAAETYGYSAVWVGDAVSSSPRLEALTTLSAVAVHTKHVKLGTAVLLSGLRNPCILAQQIATLDVISLGRVILGVGIGGGESRILMSEFPACGLPYAERTKRFVEGLKVMKKLWTERQVNYSSDTLTLEEIQVEPKPVQKPHPPIWIAGGHFGTAPPKQLERIVKYGDGFMSTLIYPDEFRKIFNNLRAIAEEHGKSRSRIHPSLYMNLNVNNDEHHAISEGNGFLVDYYGEAFWEDRWGPFGSPSKVIKSIDAYANAGVETFIIAFAAKDQAKQLELFTREVFPSFK